MRLASTTATTKGMPDLPIIEVPHPVGGMDEETAFEKGRAIADQIVRALTREK
jgi:hypothetical protein